MATIANLIVEISAKSNKLKEGLANASASVASFAKKAAASLAVIGTIITTVLVGAFSLLTGMINRQAEKIDAMSKEAQKIGASYGEFQKLAYGADLAGVSSDSLSASIKKLNINIGEAQSGSGGAKDAFDRLGLSATALANMNVEERFLAVSDALKTVKDKTEQSKLAVDIFGKSGVDGMVFLTSNIRETSKEFEDLGLVITDQQAAAVEAFNDSKTRLGTIWEGFKDKITAAVAPAFQAMVDWITGVVKEMGGMDKAADAFARSMISGVKLIVTALGGLITMLTRIQKLFLFFDERQLSSRRDEILQNAPGVGDYNLTPQKSKSTQAFIDFAQNTGASYIPSIKTQQELADLDKQIEENHQQFSLMEDSQKLLIRTQNQLNGLLTEQKQLIGKKTDMPVANAADFYKDSVIGQVITDLQKSQEQTTKGFDMMAQAAIDNAEKIKNASTSVDDAISALEKSAGQSELTRILGLNDKKGDPNPIARSDKFDELVRKIYQKATVGVQEEYSGTFNGKQITVGKATTLEQDLASLQGIIESTGRGGGNVLGMKGAFDELTKFVNNKQQQTVKVDINVKADKGFLAEVTTSQELQKAVDERISQKATDAAKQARG